MEELQAQLEKELKADFILLDGIPANEKQYLAVPLVMLKMEPSGKLLPMVIQEEANDPPLAWLLAKMWVRSSDSQLHELQYHLMSTHLVGEVIAVATMRCLPGLHPVFKPGLSRIPTPPHPAPHLSKPPSDRPELPKR
ncbi:hypothetical protein QTO34_009547 [Cnephaeus nilssonii]|uniref:Lipoxygenase domain-containing protein n=1 Tax=Cnephaeus nilssonii TaxID=3371016 RepID=A0AA40LGA2_CNENI|nr:hypothetical protein QTO34_009547 [Eptesicus nilssonii]